MTIETKYNIGDEVWFGSIGRLRKATIKIIKFHIWDGGHFVRYEMNCNGHLIELNEAYLFPTKKELLKSLQV